MEHGQVLSKQVESWLEEHSLLRDAVDLKPVFWTNPGQVTTALALEEIELTQDDVKDAQARLDRFAPYIKRVFPETEKTKGIIESPVKRIGKMQNWLSTHYKNEIPGQLLLKCDSHLAISGSIKARGGIYEVLKHAEDLAVEKGLLSYDDDYKKIDSDAFRNFYSNYSIAVGSTGNLGLSIGIMSAKLGFKVYVHMSADAKQWKKDLLRDKGVTVVEYASDYSKAVEEGRKQSDNDPNSYFVDDENSKNLFLGYAVAAYRLKNQLSEMAVEVSENKPLFVYLPCGVGGGPGGVAFGLKLVFGDAVHCFFAEPTHSPCMLIGLITGAHDQVSVQDFGIDNKTEADGLAVGRASGFVGKTLEKLISGDYTVDDDTLFILLKALQDEEDIFMEPSAFAGIAGIPALFTSVSGIDYIKKWGLSGKLDQATHLAWGTGGRMVPKIERENYYEKGTLLASR
jgi:D-serine dehydratase